MAFTNNTSSFSQGVYAKYSSFSTVFLNYMDRVEKLFHSGWMNKK
jgi:hypothetical protein